jgi:hypothetical protein
MDMGTDSKKEKNLKNFGQKADIGHSSTGAKICFTLYDFKSN